MQSKHQVTVLRLRLMIKGKPPIVKMTFDSCFFEAGSTVFLDSQSTWMIKEHFHINPGLKLNHPTLYFSTFPGEELSKERKSAFLR